MEQFRRLANLYFLAIGIIQVRLKQHFSNRMHVSH
jgi:hypothetical protein